MFSLAAMKAARLVEPHKYMTAVRTPAASILSLEAITLANGSR